MRYDKRGVTLEILSSHGCVLDSQGDRHRHGFWGSWWECHVVIACKGGCGECGDDGMIDSCCCCRRGNSDRLCKIQLRGMTDTIPERQMSLDEETEYEQRFNRQSTLFLE
jgi:hypothetical protein